MVIDIEQNKGVVSYEIDQPFKIYKPDGSISLESYEFSLSQLNLYELEVLYKDGRTETINFNMAVG